MPAAFDLKRRGGGGYFCSGAIFKQTAKKWYPSGQYAEFKLNYPLAGVSPLQYAAWAPPPLLPSLLQTLLCGQLLFDKL
jgi:hypothetical protein